MGQLPNSERAILDLIKIEDYCLNPMHPRGRHKARVFREALKIERADAVWLRGVLLQGALDLEAVPLATDRFGSRWRVDVTIARQGRTAVVRTIWDCVDRRAVASICNVLGLMTPGRTQPQITDVVALLTPLSEEGLARGQVGTVVESLDRETVLVEFSDDEGRSYAIVPCRPSELLILRYVPEAA